MNRKPPKVPILELSKVLSPIRTALPEELNYLEPDFIPNPVKKHSGELTERSKVFMTYENEEKKDFDTFNNLNESLFQRKRREDLLLSKREGSDFSRPLSNQSARSDIYISRHTPSRLSGRDSSTFTDEEKLKKKGIIKSTDELNNTPFHSSIFNVSSLNPKISNNSIDLKIQVEKFMLTRIPSHLYKEATKLLKLIQESLYNFWFPTPSRLERFMYILEVLELIACPLGIEVCSVLEDEELSLILNGVMESMCLFERLCSICILFLHHLFYIHPRAFFLVVTAPLDVLMLDIVQNHLSKYIVDENLSAEFRFYAVELSAMFLTNNKLPNFYYPAFFSFPDDIDQIEMECYNYLLDVTNRMNPFALSSFFNQEITSDTLQLFSHVDFPITPTDNVVKYPIYLVNTPGIIFWGRISVPRGRVARVKMNIDFNVDALSDHPLSFYITATVDNVNKIKRKISEEQEIKSKNFEIFFDFWPAVSSYTFFIIKHVPNMPTAVSLEDLMDKTTIESENGNKKTNRRYKHRPSSFKMKYQADIDTDIGIQIISQRKHAQISSKTENIDTIEIDPTEKYYSEFVTTKQLYFIEDVKFVEIDEYSDFNLSNESISEMLVMDKKYYDRKTQALHKEMMFTLETGHNSEEEENESVSVFSKLSKLPIGEKKSQKTRFSDMFTSKTAANSRTNLKDPSFIQLHNSSLDENDDFNQDGIKALSRSFSEDFDVAQSFDSLGDIKPIPPVKYSSKFHAKDVYDYKFWNYPILIDHAGNGDWHDHLPLPIQPIFGESGYMKRLLLTSRTATKNQEWTSIHRVGDELYSKILKNSGASDDSRTFHNVFSDDFLLKPVISTKNHEIKKINKTFDDNISCVSEFLYSKLLNHIFYPLENYESFDQLDGGFFYRYEFKSKSKE
eukprot:TRINITY_DN936_c0_g1_i1.p1 TRINITY_DN936_c0_g1~~TRINITY_DN936_c0_g1_i1.p1  ORF type:complete len:920 (-),score=217.41 TRINITY_DN936_c0_g1_i1:23-2731(-)